MLRKNKIQALSKCFCKMPHASKIFEGVCGTCFGNIPAERQLRSHTPTPNQNQKIENLEDLIKLKSQISEKAYLKTIKAMSLLKSVSGSALPEKIQHKRSNASNKPEGKFFIIPEEKISMKKINHLHTESQPNNRCSSIPKISFSKSTISSSDVYTSSVYEKSKSINYKAYLKKNHDRALSSRVYKLSNSPIPELRFPSISEYPETISRKSEDGLKYFSTECTHLGHSNTVSSVVFLQGKPFSSSYDYNIIS